MKTLDEFLNKQYRTKAPVKGSIVLQKQRKKLYGMELPEGWDVVSFGQIFRLVDKKSRKVKIKDDQTYRRVTVKLYAKGVVLREIKQGSEIKTKTMYRIQEGDFIISKIDARNGAYGFVPRELDGAVVSGDFPIWQLKELDYVNKDFVDLYLSQPTIWELIRNFVTGSTNRKRVSPEEFMYLVRIPLPPLEEQRKIVYVLKTVQQAIEQQEKITETTKELKRALMRRLFTKGLDPNQPTKMTEIGEIPEHWKVVPLEKLAFKRSKMISPKEALSDNMPYLGLEHIESEWIHITKYGDPTTVKSSKYLFYKGDILYGKLRPYLDKAVIAPFNGMCSTDIIVLKVNEEVVDRFYLAYLLHHPKLVSYATTNMDGLNHPRISWEKLKVFKLPLPTLEEQRRIANILLTVDRKVELAQQKRKALEALFSTLRRKLMAGQIRVSNLKIPTE